MQSPGLAFVHVRLHMVTDGAPMKRLMYTIYKGFTMSHRSGIAFQFSRVIHSSCPHKRSFIMRVLHIAPILFVPAIIATPLPQADSFIDYSPNSQGALSDPFQDASSSGDNQVFKVASSQPVQDVSNSQQFEDSETGFIQPDSQDTYFLAANTDETEDTPVCNMRSSIDQTPTVQVSDALPINANAIQDNQILNPSILGNSKREEVAKANLDVLSSDSGGSTDQAPNEASPSIALDGDPNDPKTVIQNSIMAPVWNGLKNLNFQTPGLETGGGGRMMHNPCGPPGSQAYTNPGCVGSHPVCSFHKMDRFGNLKGAFDYNSKTLRHWMFER